MTGRLRSSAAIVLRIRPYEENHIIAHLLSPELGKISAFARAARRSVKRFGALLEPGQSVVAYLQEPRSELGNQMYRLDKLDPNKSLLGLRESSQKLNACFFALSLLDANLPEGPVDYEIYNNLLAYLEALNSCDGKCKISWMKTLFWLKNAQLMGYGGLEKVLSEPLLVLRRVLKQHFPHLVKIEYETFRDVPEGALPLILRGDLEKLGFHWKQITGSDWAYEKLL